MSINRPEKEPEKTDEPIEWNPDNVEKDILPMLDRLQSFCKKEGITLIAVTTPIPGTTYEKGLPKTAESEAYMQACMDERGLTYFNYMHAVRDGISLDLDDYSDNDGHMYWDTARDFTGVLAQDIKSIQ